MDACQYARASLWVCTWPTVCHVWETLPRGKHGCSFLFFALVSDYSVFYECHGNLLSPPSPVPAPPKMGECSKDTHWSRRLQRLEPLSLSPPCHSFMNAAGGKVAAGELQQTICSKQKGCEGIVELRGEQPGPCVAARPNSFSFCACFSLDWFI